MALDGPEMAADERTGHYGIWVMGDGTAAVSVGFRAAYVHVQIPPTRRDLKEAQWLIRDLGYVPDGPHEMDQNDVFTFPYRRHVE